MHTKQFLPFGVLLTVTLFSAAFLSSNTSFADEETIGASVTVTSACTMFRESTVAHAIAGLPDHYYQDIGTTRLNTMCNDKDGYTIYAIGYSNDIDGDTNMYGEEHGETIPTGIETGDVSNWSMKLTKDLESYNPENLTITPSFTNYTNIPSTQTKVASFTGATDTVKGSVVETTYAIRVSSTQLADTYEGQVKYTMVHPADGEAPEGPEPAISYIQNITPKTCPTTPTTVVDSRDGKEYTIQKLADGNCWLLDNLRLDLTDADVQSQLTSSTTNASDATLNYLKNGGGATSDQYATTGVANWTSGYSYSAPLINTTYDNTTGNSGYSGGEYGTFYNYCAASAGSYCYGNGTNEGSPSGDATEDICPKGWRMPTGGISGEYQALYEAYGSDETALINALHTPFSGNYSSGTLYVKDVIGFFLSSTYYGGISMYTLRVENGGVYTQVSVARYTGNSVRCIAKASEPNPEPTYYMQDVNEWRDSLDINESLVATDRRDGKEYWVTKVQTDPAVSDERMDCAGTGDNRVCTQIIMTQNLDFDLSTNRTYTHADTDLGWTDKDENVVWTPGVSTSDAPNDFTVVDADRSVNLGDYYYYTSNTEDDDTIYSSLQACVTAGHNEDSCKHYHAGNLYNYYTAAALGATTGGNSIPVGNTYYSVMPNSICPAGWKLPTGATKIYSDYSYILYENGVTSTRSSTSYTNTGLDSLNAMREEPFWFVRTGSANGNTLENQASYGVYWVSTVNSNTKAYHLQFYYGRTNSDRPDDRSKGFAVRCVARSVEKEEYYMQDVANWQGSLGVGESMIAVDKRDNKRYWVTKVYTDPSIPDERADCTGEGANRVCTQLWMTENLDLELEAGTKTYTHADTDLGWTNNDENVIWTPQAATGTVSSFVATTTGDSSAGVNTSISSNAEENDAYLITNIENSLYNDHPANLMACVLNYGYTEDECKHRHGGNIYNYYSAAALGATSNGSAIAVDKSQYSEAPNSICPAGWRLPTGLTSADDHSDYDYLLYRNSVTSSLGGHNAKIPYADHLYGDENTPTIGYDNLREDPLWIIRSGGKTTTSWYDVAGFFWTNAFYDSTKSYSFYFLINTTTSVSNVYPSYAYAANSGFGVRCVARKSSGSTPTPEPEPTVEHDIQDVTPSTCPTTPTTVYDTRDGQAYTIQKLADGKCWMLDNLRLGKRALTVLTPDDTNITSNFTLPASIDSGFNSYVLPQINIDSKSDTVSYGSGENKVGVYYNFCAATAGTYCQPLGESSGTPTQDICPKGWRLPTGGDEGEYQALFNEYDTYAEFKNALHASLSGYFKYAQNNHQGSYGSFWSSTPVGDDRMYSLDVRLSSVPDDFTSYRTAGLSIRCVAYEQPKTYIQDIDASTCPTTPTTVYDTRDNSAYTIQKLADGNCWMLDNLRIGKSTSRTLTPNDTNITSNFTLPASVNTGFNEYTTPQINIDSKNKITSYGDGNNKIGVYYNFCAATAGTYCYAQGEAEGSPTEDICPKGWRMPTGGESGEYQALYSKYNTYADFKNALRASLSGYFKYAQNNHQGSYGSFWSTTPVGDDRMYSLDVRADSVPDDFTSYRTAGISVRCVAVSNTIYIQDVTTATCPTTPTVVYDKRDNEEYTIQKLADGKCWMLDHLRLDPATLVEPLTSENTNLASGRTYTLPSSISSGFNNYSAAQINTDSKNTLVNYGTGAAQGKAGVYYNYCAATAGTVCYSSSTATQDICPAGWRLPTGGSSGGEFNDLYRAYGSNMQTFGDAFHMAFTGVYWNNGRSDFGIKGRSWSANSRFSGNSYGLCYEYENGVYKINTADTNGQDIGMGVRCVAK